MSGCNDKKNPLQRSGTSQLQRLLPGLQDDYVNIDERGFADWMVFASAFARYVNYYDLNGAIAGDWTPFFINDLSALLGTMAIQGVAAYKRAIKERFDFIKKEAHAADMNAVEEKLTELFSAVLTLSKALDDYLKKLPDTTSLKNTLQNSIQTKLSPALQRLLTYYKALTDPADPSMHYLHASNSFNWKVFNHPVLNAAVIITQGLSNYWWSGGATSWNDYYTNSIKKDSSIFGEPAWTEYRRIHHAVNHNLFASVFDTYLMTFARLVQEAGKELLRTLTDWPDHPPHYALFLSFLQLFKTAQSGLNTLTQRHLDFYYKEVLQLLPKSTQPNHAHIIVELARQVADYELKKGTLFNAGKDTAGNEVVYALDKDTTFNKAKVVQLKSVYKGSEEDNILTTSGNPVIVNKGRLFAAPVINSEDGLGKELTSLNKEWHPFVHKQYEEGALQAITLPPAQIGFAVASHALYLTEGERKVYIRLVTNTNAALSNAIDCYLTTEKGWYQIPATNVEVGTGYLKSDVATACTQISLTLTGDAPAIAPYNVKVHGGTFICTTPVLKVYLQNELNTTTYAYDDLKDSTITQVEVDVEIGMEGSYSQQGLKQLLLSNDFGPVDASKPFQPFGAQPKAGDMFVIGNKELFTKPNAAIKLNIEWGNLPASVYDINYNTSYGATYDEFGYSYTAKTDNTPYYPTVTPQFLINGIWQNKDDTNSAIGDVTIFSESGTTPVAKLSVLNGQKIPSKAIETNPEEYNTYNAASKNGFLRLVLDGDFGHKQYISDLTSYLLEKNYSNYQFRSVPFKPVEPYTPTIQSLYVSYSAFTASVITTKDEKLFQERSIQFFHLYPFGEAEQHAYLAKDTIIYLLPQFSHTEKGSKVDQIGEFYIGLQQLQAQQSVNILFQVLEGSVDPLVDKPDDHITWSYLSNNTWVDFDKQYISDATRQLIQSGIITFKIPEEATIHHTMLPDGYIWLKAGVTKAAEAVAKLLAVEAQAAVVTLEPHHNAPDFLDTSLPAGTITKLKFPQAAVKKITQPFSSFGGRPAESSQHFYIRVSERLRHKDRAITIWDYEHLVLEAFPQIHKVKCLNHTQFETNPKTNQVEYNEVLPGHVCVITIPDLVNRNDTNPLRPYTNQNLLKEIEAYLQKRISCHVRLKVQNPQFEEVRLSFRLKLMKGYDDFTFYANQLRQEITQFLTPWAFYAGVDIQFGGKIYKSTLINFIEERPYVDYITDVAMYQRIDEKSNVESGDQETVTASTAKSILVSAPASKHQITEIVTKKETVMIECVDPTIERNEL